MSEELENKEPAGQAPVSEPAKVDVPVEQPSTEPVAPKSEEPTPSAEPEKPKESEPQVIIQKERGFAHYVGFALLFVIGVCLFFVPGLAITYGVSQLVENLPLTAIWLFSAILSVIIWIIFKVKIKGFKKAFYWYLGLAILVLAAFIGIDFAVEGHAVKKAWNMMVGNPQQTTEVSAPEAAPNAAPAAAAPAVEPVASEPATEVPATETPAEAPAAEVPASEQASPAAEPAAAPAP